MSVLNKRQRVELSAHTRINESDNSTDVEDVIRFAYSQGMPAVAITDNSNVEAYMDAYKAWQELGDDKFKVIYGMELFVWDDQVQVIVGDCKQTIFTDVVVMDVETSGLSPIEDKIIEVGAVKLINGKVVDRYATFVNPKCEIEEKIEEVTGITNEMVKESPDIGVVLP